MDSKAWLSLCVLHAVASMLVWWAGDAWAWELTWRADTWLSRPWTLWTTAWVHINTPHLIGNQLAVGALAAAAWLMRPHAGASLAWLVAWPLLPPMPDATSRRVVMPSPDLLYALCPFDVRQQPLRELHRAEDVGLEEPVDGLVGEFLHRPGLALTRVVHDDVDVADRVGAGLDRIPVGQVEGDVLDAGQPLVVGNRVRVAARAEYSVAKDGEFARHFQPDSRRCSGDQCGPARPCLRHTSELIPAPFRQRGISRCRVDKTTGASPLQAANAQHIVRQLSAPFARRQNERSQ